MDLEGFMAAYRRAWETADEDLLASLFAPDGVYHNTPFAEQRGHAAIRAYWQRVKLQRDIQVRYQIVHAHPGGGVARWQTTYQVASEEMFRMWAVSAGTPMVARQPGDPLPRLALDGVALVELDPSGLCRRFRIWWHSAVAG
jgi:uncharacterized protein (TIGR02246 family)